MSHHITRNLLLSSPALLLAVASLGSTAVPAAVLTVGPPGATAGCSHPTLQAAIDAAAASPGPDTIRIARGTYPAQHLIIDDDYELAIEAGFASCQNLVRVDYSTLDGQNSTPAGPVIEHKGEGTLTLSDLHIQHGDATRSGTTFADGGGVASYGEGRLYIQRILLWANRANRGGGLFVAPDRDYSKQITLQGVSVIENQATQSGGGIYAAHADLHITGAAASSFAGNAANGTLDSQGGGAIFASGVEITIDAVMPTNVPFMDGNTSKASGGAVYLTSTAAYDINFKLVPIRGGGTAEFSDNTASYTGGAFFISAMADGAVVRVHLVDAVLSDNMAPKGSAIQLYASGNPQTRANFHMFANSFNTACAASWRCNRISGNVSNGYGTIVAETAGTAQTSFEMQRGHIVDNSAIHLGGLIDNIGPGNETIIDNSVVADNDFGNFPMVSASAELRIENSTIANNLRAIPALIKTNGAAVYLHNNIIFQPAVPLYAATGSPLIDICNLMLGSTQLLGNEFPRNIQYTQDPLFVNPGQGDYRLQVGSQARNRYDANGCAAVSSADLLFATRPDRPELPTPYDFGAYEYGAVVDRIFLGDFDGEFFSRPAEP